MQELRQSTEVKVRIGSAVDTTDGVTPETTLVLGTADQAELLKHNGAATVDISARTFAAITGADGWYDLTLTTSNTDTLGQVTVVIQDSSLMAPIFRDFMVVTANYWDSKYSTDNLQVDTVQWLGTAAAPPTVAGVPEVDMTHCGGSTVAAGAIPNAAADAAGGLPISDAGGLDLDTKLAHTNEITSARLAELDAANLPADIADVLTQVANLITRTKGLNDIHDDLVTAQADLDIITGSDGALLAAAATSAQLVDDVWDEILTGVTHNIVNSAGRRVREIGAYAVESGTAQAGDTYSITLAATASATDGIYNRNLVVLTDNTGVGQTRTIVDYDGTTKVAVIDRDWRVTPDNTTSYQVTADNTPLVVDQGVAQDGTATTIKLRAYASSINDTYLCNVVAIIAGTGRGQARLVGSYNGTTKVVTICGDNWITTPDTTSVYVLMPYGTTCTSCIGDYALGLINTECDTALTDYDPPTKTEMDSAFTEIKGATWAAGTDTLEHIRNKETDIETDTAEIGTAGAGLTDLGGMSTGMKAEVNAQVVDTLTVDPIADSYATDGSQPTIAQALLAIQQMMQEKSITGTTLSVKKPDGSTSAMTFTLDSATAPTSITRST